MTEATTQNDGRRRAWLAAVLSILMPGVGHVYCGKLTRGLVFGLLYGVAVPVVLGLLAYMSPASTVLFGFLMVAAMFGVVIAAAVDAYKLAIKTRPDYELKAYNHPVVYALFGLMIQGSSVGYALHVRASLFEAFRIPSCSNYPAIVPNDRILVDKTAYRKADPQSGDTVMFKPPNANWRTHYIKRIVALEGDTVEMKEGRLYVNGKRLPLRKLAPSEAKTTKVEVHGEVLEGEFFEEANGDSKYTIFLATPNYEAVLDLEKVTVPKHHCFVLGDNRNYSLDSRHFGPIPYGAIEGRADYVYWPADKWSRFGRLN
jgi:signal peptidase I